MQRRFIRLSLVALFLSCKAGPERTDGAPGLSSSTTPMRVVSLTPSATEVVFAVGAGDRLVGVDKFSAYPPQVKDLPKVGDFLSPNLEALVALRPDLVVLDSVQERFVERLSSFKIRCLPIPMQTVADVRGALLAVGEALGRKEAAVSEVARLDARLAQAEARAREAAQRAGRRPRVLFVVDRRSGGLAGMVAAGPGTYIDELLGRAGVENALADASVRYVQISAEEVLARAPDIILDAVHVDDPEKARGDWTALASVPAVANGRVHVLGDPLFVTPGPRLDDAFERLCAILWPR